VGTPLIFTCGRQKCAEREGERVQAGAGWVNFELFDRGLGLLGVEKIEKIERIEKTSRILRKLRAGQAKLRVFRAISSSGSIKLRENRAKIERFRAKRRVEQS
jgi:hypothetical protein